MLKNLTNSKFIFYVLIFLLPVNLGKHFVFPDSHVLGLLVDYRVPTVFVQDILLIYLLFLWLFKDGFYKKLSSVFFDFLPDIRFKFLIFFLFCVFLSTIGSFSFLVSLCAFLRLILYSFLIVFVKTTFSLSSFDIFVFFNDVRKVLFFPFLFLCVLGIFQFINQSSVFNNYLVLGEQPYTFSTRGITHESFFGSSKVPSYGLFRHPNVFGSYLSIFLIWLLPLNPFIFFVVGIGALLLTGSIFSWISFAFGILFLIPSPVFRRLLTLGVFLSFVFSFFLPSFLPLAFKENIFDISFLRRAYLLNSSYNIISKHFLFGVGFNNITSFIEEGFTPLRSVRFVQPVHNIFVLIFAESGFFAFVFFLLFLGFSFKSISKHVFFPELFLKISLLQIIFLSCFDHYFLTIHQTQLILWLVLSFVFLYT